MNIKDREKEIERRKKNLKEFGPIALAVMQKYCVDNGLKLTHTEETPIDFEGVDFIITTNKREIPLAFRVIKSNAKCLFLRYSGALGGESEAQKIEKDKTMAIGYATYEMTTKIFRIYKMSDIKEWLQSPRQLSFGDDGSRYYKIPFSDLKPIEEIQM